MTMSLSQVFLITLIFNLISISVYGGYVALDINGSYVPISDTEITTIDTQWTDDGVISLRNSATTGWIVSPSLDATVTTVDTLYYHGPYSASHKIIRQFYCSSQSTVHIQFSGITCNTMSSLDHIEFSFNDEILTRMLASDAAATVSLSNPFALTGKSECYDIPKIAIDGLSAPNPSEAFTLSFSVVLNSDNAYLAVGAMIISCVADPDTTNPPLANTTKETLSTSSTSTSSSTSSTTTTTATISTAQPTTTSSTTTSSTAAISTAQPTTTTTTSSTTSSTVKDDTTIATTAAISTAQPTTTTTTSSSTSSTASTSSITTSIKPPDTTITASTLQPITTSSSSTTVSTTDAVTTSSPYSTTSGAITSSEAASASTTTIISTAQPTTTLASSTNAFTTTISSVETSSDPSSTYITSTISTIEPTISSTDVESSTTTTIAKSTVSDHEEESTINNHHHEGEVQIKTTQQYSNDQDDESADNESQEMTNALFTSGSNLIYIMMTCVIMLIICGIFIFYIVKKRKTDTKQTMDLHNDIEANTDKVASRTDITDIPPPPPPQNMFDDMPVKLQMGDISQYSNPGSYNEVGSFSKSMAASINSNPDVFADAFANFSALHAHNASMEVIDDEEEGGRETGAASNYGEANDECDNDVESEDEGCVAARPETTGGQYNNVSYVKKEADHYHNASHLKKYINSHKVAEMQMSPDRVALPETRGGAYRMKTNGCPQIGAPPMPPHNAAAALPETAGREYKHTVGWKHAALPPNIQPVMKKDALPVRRTGGYYQNK